MLPTSTTSTSTTVAPVERMLVVTVTVLVLLLVTTVAIGYFSAALNNILIRLWCEALLHMCKPGKTKSYMFSAEVKTKA